MAVTFIASSAFGSSTANDTVVVNKPTGTLEGHIMFAIIYTLGLDTSTPAGSSPTTIPSGWTKLGDMSMYFNPVQETYSRTATLYYKIAGASEPADYTWIYPTKSSRTAGRIFTYSVDDLDTSDPIDVVSNTVMDTTLGTAVRAQTMTVSNTNSPLFFFGMSPAQSALTFTKPTVPTTDWVEDFDGGSTVEDFFMCVDSMIWTSSGATGVMSGTMSSSQSLRGAFAVALNIITSTDYPIIIGQGSFSLTGQSVALHLGRKLFAGLGSFSLIYQTVDFLVHIKNTIMEVTHGVFALTSKDTILRYGRTMLAETGNFILNGFDILIHRGYAMAVTAGEFTLTAQDTILRYGRTMVAEVGNFVLTGQSVVFHLAWKIAIATGTFTLTSINTVLNIGRKIVAVLGEFTLTGMAALFPRASKVFATVGSFILTGFSARGLLNGVSILWRAASKTAVATMANISKNTSTWINKLKS